MTTSRRPTTSNLDLLPADFSYRHLDLALDQFKKPASRLGRVLAPLRAEYDYIFLDCPPSISLVSEAVFEASDALLVPVIPSTLSSRAYEQLETLARNGKVGRKRQDGDLRLLLDGRRQPVACTCR